MRSRIVTWLALGCVAGLFVACYGRAIFQGEQFAYRDAGDYYYPLHQRVQSEWNAGRWPLWEPEENGGMPLLGNPTAAVLYPGKLVFAVVDYPLAARLYIMGHTLLALAAMSVLLRHWGASRAASALGALGYAFGAPVLFQSCNVIFLVGAAWLPLGIRAADRWLRLGRRIALAELAVVLAMQTLGGDPESAYLVGVCAGGYAAGLAWRGRATVAGAASGVCSKLLIVAAAWCAATLAAAHWLPPLRPSTGGPAPAPFVWTPWVGPLVASAWGLAGLVLVVKWVRRRTRPGSGPALVPMLFGLVVAAAVAAAVSAAQLLPAIEFIRQSTRAGHGGARYDKYAFSLHPARLAELIWPNVFGTTFRGNTLWLGAFAPRTPDVRLWVPTLYLGGLTLVLAVGGSAFGRRDEDPEPARRPWRAWMAAVAAISLLASFGEYGSPLWLARVVSSAAPSTRVPGALEDGDGGLYWLLATVLPGFGLFRFPSKLLTFTVLGLAVLAARGWDAIVAGDARARRWSAACATLLFGLSLAALAATAVGRSAFLAWLNAQEFRSMYGPIDALGALAETRRALLQGAVIMAASLALTSRRATRRPEMAASLALVIVCVDLALGNALIVATVPQSAMDAGSDAGAAITQAERARPTPGPFRIFRTLNWTPLPWSQTRAADRFRNLVIWEHETLCPKYAVNLGFSYTLTLGATQLFDHERFFGGFNSRARENTARLLHMAPGAELAVYPRRSYDLWNTRYFILPYSVKWDDAYRGIASFVERTEQIAPPPGAFAGPDGARKEQAWIARHDYQVRRNLNAYPRAWVVHGARSLPDRVAPGGGADRDQFMYEMLFSNDISWPDPNRVVHDPRRVVWLESSTRRALDAFLPGGLTAPDETVAVARYEPDRVELDAVLRRPGIVVLADTLYPGWSLTIDGRAAPMIAANRMMRAAAVDAGRHRLVYSFRSASFQAGFIVSGLGLAALVLLAAWSLATRRGDRKAGAAADRRG